MLTEYIQAAMRRAQYKILDGNEGFFGRIPDCQGVWANAGTLEECRHELQEVLEDWILIRIARGLAIPTLDGISIHIKELA